MPYSSPDDPDLPKNVQALPEKQRAQWFAIWNRTYQDCQESDGDDCEGKAFRVANGVLKRREDHEMTTNILYTDLASLVSGQTFDALAPGKFVDMHGRKLEITADDLAEYVANTQAAIEATRAESGEVVGLPIDAQDHDKGDGAGWIVGIDLENGKVRVRPQWTEIGKELIEKSIRRFFSATLDTARKVILGGTLTNWPASRDHKTGHILLKPIELESQLYAVDPDEKQPGWLDELKAWLSEKLGILDAVELTEFDDSEWDGGAVVAGMDVDDLRRCCLLDLNGYPGQEGDPTKSLCKLPYKTSPGAAPNKAALRAMAGGRGFSALKKPAEVPDEFYSRKLRSAASKAASLWRQAFDTDVPQSIAGELSSGKDTVGKEDKSMAIEMTEDQLQALIDSAVQKAVQPPPAPNGNGDSTRELLSFLGLDELEEAAQQRIEAKLALHFEAVQKAAEQRYMQQLSQVVRKREAAELAAKLTGGTEENPRGLPTTAEELAKRLLALPADEAKFWTQLCQDVVAGKVVEFKELGHARDTQGAKELPTEVAHMLRTGELKLADLNDPILALGDLAEYDLAEFKK